MKTEDIARQIELARVEITNLKKAYRLQAALEAAQQARQERENKSSGNNANVTRK